jgi:hypothetical protein
MSGIQPVPTPNPPKVINTCVINTCGYGVKGLSVVQAPVPCQQHWHRVHVIRGVAGVHASRVSELVHPAHAFTSTIKPLKQTNMYKHAL